MRNPVLPSKLKLNSANSQCTLVLSTRVGVSVPAMIDRAPRAIAFIADVILAMFNVSTSSSTVW